MNRKPDYTRPRQNGPVYMLLLFFIAWVGAAGLTGCSSSRKTTEAKTVRDRSPEFLMRQLIAQQIDADWIDARAKVDYDDGSLSIGATADIRLRKDSVLWVAVKKLGFEVGRALITPDSIYVLDRLNNEAVVKDIGYIANKYNIPADFQVLQSLILGNPLFFMTRGFSVETVDQLYHLYGEKNGMNSHYWLGNEGFRLERMHFEDERNRRSILMQFDGYEQEAKDKNFSYLRNLEVDSKETGKVAIGLRFSQVEFNVPKNIRFEIPERYTRVD